MAPTSSSSKRRQFTPRTRSAQDEQRHRGGYRLFWSALALPSPIGGKLARLLNQSGDSKLEIKDVKIANSGEIALTGHAIKVLHLLASLS